jgi:hypothetical protein
MRASLLSIPILVLHMPVSAVETVTYRYDALGRLVRTGNFGGPQAGVDSVYDYDKAGNRSQVVVTGAPMGNPPGPPTSARQVVAVLPGIGYFFVVN